MLIGLLIGWLFLRGHGGDDKLRSQLTEVQWGLCTACEAAAQVSDLAAPGRGSLVGPIVGPTVLQSSWPS